MIIHINGWPGVGKNTIGNIVARKVGGRFIHNHVLHDVAWACAGRGDEEYWPLYESVRSAAYKVLERKSENEIFVMTNALCKTADREIVAWKHVVELAINRRVPLVPVVLNAPIDVLTKRITDPERLETKLKDADHLTQMLDKHDLLIPRSAETFQLETGNLSAEESASKIAKYCSVNCEMWNAATEDHINFE